MSYNNLFWGDTVTPNHSQWCIKAENLLPDRNIWQATIKKYFPLGALAESRDGRRWRYCEKDGTTDLVKCLLVQKCAGAGGWQTEIQTYNPDIPALGEKRLTVSITTTAAAHDFIDGYLSVETGTGIGDLYLVKDNEVGTDNATQYYDVVLEIADTGGIRTAWSTSDTEITLTKNKYKDVLVVPNTNITNVVIGVPLVAVPVNYFFWAQTRGPCPVTSETNQTIVVGDWVMASEATAGSIDILDGALDDHPVGVVMRAVTTAEPETAIIDLRLE